MLTKISTSAEVSIFFSLILSYFCFLVPALRPCHGRLSIAEKHVKYNIDKIGNMVKYTDSGQTFLLKNIAEDSQQTPDHLSCFVLGEINTGI